MRSIDDAAINLLHQCSAGSFSSYNVSACASVSCNVGFFPCNILVVLTTSPPPTPLWCLSVFLHSLSGGVFSLDYQVKNEAVSSCCCCNHSNHWDNNIPPRSVSKWERERDGGRKPAGERGRSGKMFHSANGVLSSVVLVWVVLWRAIYILDLVFKDDNNSYFGYKTQYRVVLNAGFGVCVFMLVVTIDYLCYDHIKKCRQEKRKAYLLPRMAFKDARWIKLNETRRSKTCNVFFFCVRCEALCLSQLCLYHFWGAELYVNAAAINQLVLGLFILNMQHKAEANVQTLLHSAKQVARDSPKGYK